jgi:hypothetical protein
VVGIPGEAGSKRRSVGRIAATPSVEVRMDVPSKNIPSDASAGHGNAPSHAVTDAAPVDSTMRARRDAVPAVPLVDIAQTASPIEIPAPLICALGRIRSSARTPPARLALRSPWSATCEELRCM